MRARLIIMALLTLGFVNAFGQYSNELYQYNYFSINPAFAGVDGQKFAMMVKGATFGQNDRISNVLLSYNTKFDKINSGFGLIGEAVNYGSASETSLSFNYSYKIRLGNRVNLHFGLNLKNQRSSYDYTRIIFLDPGDPLLNSPDSESFSNLLTDFGVLLQAQDFYFGLSTANLLQTTNGFSSEFVGATVYNLILGYSFKIGTWGKSLHSIYSPISNSRYYTVDLNNTLVIHEKIITGFTLELADTKFYPKLNGGFKLNDSFQVIAMIYSKRREDLSPKLKFNGSLAVNFYFK